MGRGHPGRTRDGAGPGRAGPGPASPHRRGRRGRPRGHVTYHAEALARPATTPAPFPPGLLPLLAPHPKRAPWATASGVREALAWAEERLRASGRPATGRPAQVKSWNLSGLFAIPTADGPVWLKTTPPFAASEAAVTALVARADPDLVPGALAAAPGRLLLPHIPGEDCWDAAEPMIRSVLTRWTAAQAALAVPGPALEPAPAPYGLPDRTPAALAGLVAELLDRRDLGLSRAEHDAARRLADRLPALAGALRECGLPDTVLHGDFHPGNWRSDGARTLLLDFADACLGHPALDALRLSDFLPPHLGQVAEETWTKAWAGHVPGCDPARALTLARPLQHLAAAVLYQTFLDGIEPSEYPYHLGDPAAKIRDALTVA
ncbi:aminoglycoside phosphotransferase family protein [Thermocatellispora tengchongensis]|uniref:aminoglycoside phosphotransferase family protein n=1 Tax=Thermocatellispora tengchongensis TaxID=1073253 RepID=UPI0036443D71